MSMWPEIPETKEITIGVFGITSQDEDFQEVFKKIKELPLKKRNHPVSPNEDMRFLERRHVGRIMRAEDIVLTKSYMPYENIGSRGGRFRDLILDPPLDRDTEGNVGSDKSKYRTENFWLLNFAFLKNRGPGVANLEEPIKPAHQHKKGLMYTYETAFLYCMKDEDDLPFIIVELVQRGVRPRWIKEYFSCIYRGCVPEVFSDTHYQEFRSCYVPWEPKSDYWFMHDPIVRYRETVPLPPIDEDDRETAIKEERWKALIRVLHKFDKDLLEIERFKGIAEDPSMPK